MGISAAGIIFSSLNDNTLSRLTADRTVAAIPFACRYRLIDFCLSNMVNANMSNISIVTNYNYRSLVEHIGSGKDWDLARREKGINMISPFQTARAPGASIFSTHLEALKSMKEYINEFREEYVVLMDSDTVFNMDLKEVIRGHELSGAAITIVTERAPVDFASKSAKLMVSSVGGKITDMMLSRYYSPECTEISLDVFVMKTEYLRKLIEKADSYSQKSLTNQLLTTYKQVFYRSHCYDGFVAHVSSFQEYYKYSMQLLKSEKARDSLLLKKGFPVFTRVHNSAPTLHKPCSRVENSLIADECVIEGEIINSIIFRGVHVGKGAVVKNSIIFHGTDIDENADLNCIVTDKSVHITKGVRLSGNENMPFYVQKGRKV